MSKQRIALVCIALHIAGERRDLQPGEVLPDGIAADQLADLARLKAFREVAGTTNSSSREAGTPAGEPGAAGGANAGTQYHGESGTGAEGGEGTPPSGTTGTPPPLNLNTATAAELQAVGLTAVLAARLIEWRAGLGGPIESVDHIVAVSGIGPALLARLRDRLTV